MTRLEDRQILVRDIEQACADGARLAPACALARASTPVPCGAGRPVTVCSAAIGGQMPIVRSRRTR
jgi:hypothetical protein